MLLFTCDSRFKWLAIRFLFFVCALSGLTQFWQKVLEFSYGSNSFIESTFLVKFSIFIWRSSITSKFVAHCVLGFGFVIDMESFIFVFYIVHIITHKLLIVTAYFSIGTTLMAPLLTLSQYTRILTVELAHINRAVLPPTLSSCRQLK
jgi:hypothetical protein